MAIWLRAPKNTESSCWRAAFHRDDRDGDATSVSISGYRDFTIPQGDHHRQSGGLSSRRFDHSDSRRRYTCSRGHARRSTTPPQIPRLRSLPVPRLLGKAEKNPRTRRGDRRPRASAGRPGAAAASPALALPLKKFAGPPASITGRGPRATLGAALRQLHDEFGPALADRGPQGRVSRVAR